MTLGAVEGIAVGVIDGISLGTADGADDGIVVELGKAEGFELVEGFEFK
jgi:hypothetical protein